MEILRIVDPILPEPEKFLEYYKMSQSERHYSNNGPCVRELEKRFEKILGSRIITCNNATTGLTAALMALRNSSRQTVSMSDFTFTATACAINAAGNQIRVHDIDTKEYALLADDECLSDIVIITCPFGAIPFESISRAKDDNRYIIVDAAATLGVPWSDIKKLIQMVDVVVFSLHATKTFGIGEGGLIATKYDLVADFARKYMAFGINGEGINGKLPELMAAVGLAKFDQFEEDNARRIDLATKYSMEMVGDGLELYPFTDSFQVVPFKVEKAKVLEQILIKSNIPFRKYYEAPMGNFNHVNSYQTWESNVCLPFSELMSRKDIDTVKKAVDEYRKLI